MPATRRSPFQSFLFSTNDVLDLEIAAAGTQFAATETSKGAMEKLFDGDSWMIYRNTATGILHWDFVRQVLLRTTADAHDFAFQSALGRFISFPVIDLQCVARNF